MRALARRQIAAYLTVPAYASFQRWVGRGPALEPLWRAWAAGDRRTAVASIPDAVVDELVVHGSPAECGDHLARFGANGATALALSVLDGVVGAGDVLRSLAEELDRMRSPVPPRTYDPPETNQLTNSIQCTPRGE